MGREDELLNRFRDSGHAASMETLVGMTRARLVRVAARIGAPQDAEDSVQAAYHALLRRAERPDDVVGFLVATVVRVAYRRKAAARRDAALAERLAKPRADADAPRGAIRDEETQFVRAAVHRLPAPYRDAVVLHHLEGLPLADVARLLDVPVATAKTRVQRGRWLLRAPLSPLVAHGLFFVPWKVVDVARGLGPSGAVAGGALQAKSMAAGAAALLLAFGAAGVVAARTSTAPETADVPSSAEKQAPETPKRVERRRATAAATPVVEADPTAPRDSASIPAPEAPLPKPDPSAPTAAAVEAAKTLGVSDEALRAAWTAYHTLRSAPVVSKATPEEIAEYRRRRTDALAALSACGEAAFPAVVALLKGGEQGTYFEELIAATTPSGRERLLIDLAEDPDAARWVPVTALSCLGRTDTSEVREYLLARLQRADDAYTFATVARALGRLREPRALPLCRDHVRPRDDPWNAEWTPQFRGWIVGSLPQMDKDEGARVLVECLRDPRFDLAAAAVRALGTHVGSKLAQAEARALIDSGRAESMDPLDADVVREWARER